MKRFFLYSLFLIDQTFFIKPHTFKSEGILNLIEGAFFDTMGIFLVPLNKGLEFKVRDS